MPTRSFQIQKSTGSQAFFLTSDHDLMKNYLKQEDDYQISLESFFYNTSSLGHHDPFSSRALATNHLTCCSSQEVNSKPKIRGIDLVHFFPLLTPICSIPPATGRPYSQATGLGTSHPKDVFEAGQGHLPVFSVILLVRNGEPYISCKGSTMNRRACV